MNIVVVVDDIRLEQGGGVGTCVFDLCSAFAKTGNSVYLVGVVGNPLGDSMIDRLTEQHVTCISLGCHSRKRALIGLTVYSAKLRELIVYICTTGETILNLHLKLGVLYGVVASVGVKNVIRVETYHNSYSRYYLQCWMLSPFIKHYICVSDTAKLEMHSRFRIPFRKLSSIPNGVDRNSLRGLVSCIPKSKKRVQVVTVGRLSFEKNILTTIRAYAKSDQLDFEYHIIGDGPQFQEARALAMQTQRIFLHGRRSRVEVLEALASSDIVVMPSLWEGRSILMLEAAAFDRPFILSDVDGLREPFGETALCNETYRKCKFGYLVETNNVEAYRYALADFISLSRIEKEEMAARVHDMSLENDILMVARKYIEVFRMLLARYGGRNGYHSGEI